MIRIGIYGYGNLGKGVECAIKQNKDMELVAVFTRRNPTSLALYNPTTPVYSTDNVLNFVDKIDIMILCGGSAKDLPEQTPAMAKYFHVIDSFDTHAKINEHFDNVDKTAKEGKKLAIISIGWDPGLFSVNRLYGGAVLPLGEDYTFWGKGISQGHSDAIRRIPGVIDAKQYTIPIEEALRKVRSGENPVLATREKHLRECYVVIEEGADADGIATTIKEMPNYFKDYETIVHFLTLEELQRDHSGIPHGGFVIRTGKTGWNNENNNTIEYSLKLESNPNFTASVLVAYARAAYRLAKEGQVGCKTILDIAPRYLSPKSDEELRRLLL